MNWKQVSFLSNASRQYFHFDFREFNEFSNKNDGRNNETTK